MLLLLTMTACTPRPIFIPRKHIDEPSDDTADSGLTGDTGDTGDTADSDDTGEPDPWLDPSYWTDPGPFAPLLDLDLRPSGNHWQVWMTTSTDGVAWDSEPKVIAHTFSSLDLLIYEDVAIILSGSTFRNEDIDVDAPWGNIFALTTPDLDTWGSFMWEIDGEENPKITDASLHVLPDGTIRAGYYSAIDTGDGTAPEDIPGDHDIKVADWNGKLFVENEQRVFAMEGLVDPVLCSWDDTSHLFTTGGSGVIHATTTEWEHDYDDQFQWGGVQVPFCFENDGGRYVIAQAGGGAGEPEVRQLKDEGTWTDSEPFFSKDVDDPFDGGCTSPVVGQFQGTWVMFCAVHIPADS